MANLLNIIKKEIRDLLSDRFIFVIFLIFIFVIFNTVLRTYNNLSELSLSGRLLESFLGGYSGILNNYGTLISIIIGFNSIASEKREYALNTLITKPVYRDNIINGKLVGSIIYLIMFFGMGMFIYIAISLMLFGDIFFYILVPLITELLFLSIPFLAYNLIFLSISMLLTMIVSEYGLSLILSALLWCFGPMVTDMSINGNVSYFLESIGIASHTQVGQFIMGIIPFGILLQLLQIVFFSNDGMSGFAIIFNINTIKLVIIATILMVLCHLTFLRRDIT